MADQGGGKGLAILSVLLGVVAALLVISVPAGVWNYSAEGATLLTGIIGAGLAAILAYVSRQSGGNTLNLTGLALGVAVLVIGAAILFTGSYDIEFG